MTTSDPHSHGTPDPVTEAFADPVAYLAAFGIESELVSETTFPAAA